MRLQAFKYRIYPNSNQRILLNKHFGSCRFIYNWALEEKTKAWETEKRGISIFALSNKLPEMKKGDKCWLKEINSQSLQSSLMNLDKAFTNFFRKKASFPKFKAKKNHQSFQCPQNCEADFEKDRLYVPKFKLGIKAIFHRRFKGTVKTVTFSKTPSGKYFASILVETSIPDVTPPEAKEELAVGIDMGIKDFATLSTGQKIKNPKHLNRKLKALKRQQRILSCRIKGSSNRSKQRIKVARTHEKVSNFRKDFLHKLSSKIIRDNQTICLEDLDIKGMQKDKGKAINRALNDVGWGMFKEFLTYKANWYGKNIRFIGRFEASSKTCACGVKNNKLKLNQRSWTCSSCGETHDRDILAANNIKKFAFREQNTFPVPPGERELTPVETAH